MRLSVVIPAHNEADCIEATVVALHDKLLSEAIDHEILVVNDNSTDDTESILERIVRETPTVRYVNNLPPNGFGFAIRRGLEEFSGDAVALVMADASDLPSDVVRFYRVMEEGVDCVFGSRFVRGGKTVDYPLFKLAVNRMANLFIRLLFGMKYNDTTNAFKMYRRSVIDGLQPILSHHFNITVELPLKAITRNYSYAVLPNAWINRTTGISKLRLKEMGSRYLFIVLYCLLEKWLSQGDYRKQGAEKRKPEPRFLC